VRTRCDCSFIASISPRYRLEIARWRDCETRKFCATLRNAAKRRNAAPNDGSYIRVAFAESFVPCGVMNRSRITRERMFLRVRTRSRGRSCVSDTRDAIESVDISPRWIWPDLMRDNFTARRIASPQRRTETGKRRESERIGSVSNWRGKSGRLFILALSASIGGVSAERWRARHVRVHVARCAA